MTRFEIRSEQTGDQEAIFSLTRQAFLNAPYACHTEEFIVDALRRRGELFLSLVATASGRVIGHVAFSLARLSSGESGWYGVGPLSVHPDNQGQGIGRSLMEKGMEQLQAHGARGCLLVGDPAYYQRLGFSPCDRATMAGVPPANLLMKCFGTGHPEGDVHFSEAFATTAQETGKA